MGSLSKDDILYLKKYGVNNQFEDMYWGFTCFSRQNYTGTLPRGVVDDVVYGIYFYEGGALAEMAKYWYQLPGEAAPCLEVFSDAFLLLESPLQKRIMVELRKKYSENFTSEDFSKLLIRMGFRDDSDRKI
ncbi:MAG: hypothetical protein ACLSFZ_00575 [Frisingicoccus sp.]